MLSHTPGNTVGNLSSTRALRDVTLLRGGQYYACPVGEVNVTAKMKEVGAVIGGDSNGGVIFPECHYGRDALVGIALFLSCLAQRKCKVSELRSTFPCYQIAKNSINLMSNTDVDSIFERVKGSFLKDHSVTISDTDGLKIDFVDRWVYLRKSKTEPVVRVYSEAVTMERADNLGNQFMHLFYDTQKDMLLSAIHSDYGPVM